MTAYLPEKPFGTLALSLSGGGYRAAAFHLGTLAYLDKIQFEGRSLLQRVKILSSVSGGSFTNAAYASIIQKGGTFKKCFDLLYYQMKNVDLVDDALKKLGDNKWKTLKTKNLINAFAEIYHERFFTDLFEVFWNDHPNHLQEVIFNATEFSNGLAFRFQKTGHDKGLIGNYFNRIPVKVAKELRIADLAAASSCFPGGFEPMVFPVDFQHQCSPNLDAYAKQLIKDEHSNFPMSIMDGGIVDNQGIGSVILAERRLRIDMGLKDDQQKSIDLFIISDVAGPDIEPLRAAEPEPLSGWKSWSFRKLEKAGIIFLLMFLIILSGIFVTDEKWLIALLAFTGTLTGMFGIISLILGRLVVKTVPSWFKIPSFFVKHLQFFHQIKFGVFKNMLAPRIDSAIKMITDVFLKQIRRLSYNRLYENPEWQDRVFMNAVHELKKEKVDERRNSPKAVYMSKDTLNPGPEIERISAIAASMRTTLWFTSEDLDGKENKLDSLIACGNYNICFNLLAYIEKLRSKEQFENSYDSDTLASIEKLYDQLLKDWNQFKKNPFWMHSNQNT